ncbi:COG1470 family protein [Mesorhizobium atlanticum]
MVDHPYPEFSAQAGKDVSVPLKLANHGLPPQRVELGIDGLPGGWKWEIDGGGKPVSAAIAGAGSTVDLMLKLTPPTGDVGKAVDFVVSGKASTESLKLPMVMTLAKTEPAKLTLEPKLPALRGTAKSAFDFQVDIKNEGQEDSTVNLLSKAPPGFQVTFKQGYGSQELTSLPLKAGEIQDSIGRRPAASTTPEPVNTRLRSPPVAAMPAPTPSCCSTSPAGHRSPYQARRDGSPEMLRQVRNAPSHSRCPTVVRLRLAT